MSMNPNDPFGGDASNPNAYNPNAAGQNAAPPKKSTAKYWLLGCGGVMLIGMLVCCGGGVFVTKAGMGIVAGEYESQLRGNPTVTQNIGEIESFDADLTETFQYATSNPEQGENVAFKVVGDKGSGYIYIMQDKSTTAEVRMKSAKLVMDDGTEHAIDVEALSEPIAPTLEGVFDTGELEVLEEAQ